MHFLYSVSNLFITVKNQPHQLIAATAQKVQFRCTEAKRKTSKTLWNSFSWKDRKNFSDGDIYSEPVSAQSLIGFSCQLQSVLDLNSNTFILSCDSTTAVKTIKKNKNQTRVKFVPAQLNKTSKFLSFQTTKPVVSTQSSTGGYIQRSKRLRTPLNMSGEHLLPSGLTFPWDTHTSISHSYLSVSCLSYC